MRLSMLVIFAMAACGGGSPARPDAAGPTPDSAGDAGGDAAGDAAIDAAIDAPGAAFGVDPTFGSGGVTTFDPGTVYEQVSHVCRQADGKLVGVGITPEELFVVRLATDGTLDATFGAGGVVQLPWGVMWTVAGPAGCAIQGDGKIVVAGTLGESFLWHGAVGVIARIDADGTLDTTFGTGGRYLDTSATASAAAVAVQADGKILVGGNGRMIRLATDGTLDSTFGTFTNSALTFDDIALQSTGTIVGVGGRNIAFISSTGALLGTNGTGGGSLSDNLYGVAIQSDDKVVVAGAQHFGGTQRFYVGRYTADNSVDTTFGGGTGMVLSDAGSTGGAYGVAIDPNGNIVAVGDATFGGHVGGSTRLTSTGAIDTTFGSGGVGPAVADAAGASMDPVFEADGAFTTGGVKMVATGMFEAAFDRTTATGALDSGFGSAGLATFRVGGTLDRAQAVALQSDGKLIVAGTTQEYVGGVAIRLDADGTRDASFGGTGVVAMTQLSAIAAVAVQSSGDILLGGPTGFGLGATAFGVMRYSPDGTLDTTFGNHGVAGAIAAGLAEHDMTTAADGTIVIAGQCTANSGQQFCAYELAADGTPIAGFGNQGLAVSSFAASSAATHVAVQSDGSVVELGVSNSTATLVRFTPTGVLDTAFGTPQLPDGLDFTPYGLRIQSDGAIVAVGGNYSTGQLEIVRYTPTGALDTSFGTGGMVTMMLGGTDFGLISVDKLVGLVQLPSGELELGLATSTSDGLTEQAMLIRLTATGSDTAFAPGGIQIVTPGPASAALHALTVQPDGKVVAVGRAWTPSGSSDFLAMRFLP